ncbi:hypothetical protein [Yoonia sp.]|uniref:hypothetical protein n=1 Tax=Yoonia sp. TaxID=2212373 RepID=UPI003A4D4C6C
MAKAILSSLKSSFWPNALMEDEAFDRLTAYYIEAGWLSDGEGLEPFTDFGRKLARRVKINVSDFGARLLVIKGNLPKDDDEIPF